MRIMPLGDSITLGYGSNELDGYRRDLYRAITGAGTQVDFVGSQQDGPADFDRDHEGYPGWQAAGGEGGGIAANVYNWLKTNPADFVLLHIGTNDISNSNQSADKVASILDEIDRYSRDTVVVLALIVNRNDDKKAATSQFNLDVKAMALDRISRGDKIVMVDMEHALIYPDDIKDWTHPNDTGYSKMAQVWLNALTPLLPKCQ